LVGYVVGFAAVLGTDDIDDTVEALTHCVPSDEIARRTPWPSGYAGAASRGGHSSSRVTRDV
jgi:hypothetical protein